jgi:diguanylate cyclase (GGDEF)-like protein/PAS domain S-box-containing protein
MPLRQRTLLIISLALLAMVAVISIFAHLFWLDRFAELERESLTQNATQTLRALEDELAALGRTAQDWGHWDDTYRFAADGNRDYIRTNLDPTALANLRVSFMLFIDPRGRLLHGAAVDPETAAPMPVSTDLASRAAELLALALASPDGSFRSGLILTPEDPVLLAVVPILTSLSEGPVHGALVIGRYFGSGEIQRLAQMVQLDLEVQRLDQAGLPPDYRVARPLLNDRQAVVVQEIDAERIAVYTLLRDLADRPILMLGIDRERRIFAQGLAGLKWFIGFLAVTGLVFILATSLLLEHTVLRRLARLGSEIRSIGARGSLAERVTVDGRDELTHLAAAVNDTLEALHASSERDRTILETIADAYFETDLRGRLRLFNSALCRMSGYSAAELQGRSYRHLMRPAEARQVHARLQALFASGRPIQALEGEFRRNGGRRGHVEATVALVRDVQGRAVGFRGIVRDVTERKQTEIRLAYMASHDPLTGLLNRKAFHDRLEDELRYARRYGQQRTLMFIDLDRFKEVNDRFGHAVGDTVLQAVAERLRSVLRATDVIGRLGGDEFTVLLTDPTAQRPEAAAARVLAALLEPVRGPEVTVDFVTPSIGLSRFPQDGRDAVAFLRHADEAMYRAKQKGGGLVALCP